MIVKESKINFNEKTEEMWENYPYPDHESEIIKKKTTSKLK